MSMQQLSWLLFGDGRVKDYFDFAIVGSGRIKSWRSLAR
jgi:hypothetical protein